jgi:hypothetical protein
VQRGVESAEVLGELGSVQLMDEPLSVRVAELRQGLGRPNAAACSQRAEQQQLHVASGLMLPAPFLPTPTEQAQCQTRARTEGSRAPLRVGPRRNSDQARRPWKRRGWHIALSRARWAPRYAETREMSPGGSGQSICAPASPAASAVLPSGPRPETAASRLRLLARTKVGGGARLDVSDRFKIPSYPSQKYSRRSVLLDELFEALGTFKRLR